MLKGLGGLGALGDMAGVMKKAQEVQAKMAEMQEGLAALSVTGEAGAGLVRVTANGKGDLTGIEIDPSIFAASEKVLVEDLILAAVKDAQVRAAELSQSEMARMAEGLGLPPGMKLPF